MVLGQRGARGEGTAAPWRLQGEGGGGDWKGLGADTKQKPGRTLCLVQ